MSIDPEELLEEALRNDMPSKAAEARLRRKLLAAGVAVGNGIATTTAAASGGAVAGAGGAGLVAKVAGLSWGLKVGLVAAVAIPSVGLWLERTEPATVRSAPVPHQVTPPSSAALPEPARAVAASVEPVTAPEARPSELAPKRTARGDKPAPEPTPERADIASAARPSQGDFAAPGPGPALVAQSPAGSSLGEETRLLDRAFAELGAGHRARAAELLAEHESRYPQGLLVKERERAKARISELSRGE